ncbi:MULTISPECIES: ABC transporter ATP-binding protein [Streptomyces]|uniref:ABC transporter ATP-binding protein n=1 Tax=Streptomyces changanensis TaxID=2964669 RepID=A0ABY5NAP9_9ACTN|nr:MULTISPECIES: ABC transporter ATP-binding protein [Streptomyces]UUS33102.1 ABC transporter ATP-binding protein [Streptomyces changanensis]
MPTDDLPAPTAGADHTPAGAPTGPSGPPPPPPGDRSAAPSEPPPADAALPPHTHGAGPAPADAPVPPVGPPVGPPAHRTSRPSVDRGADATVAPSAHASARPPAPPSAGPTVPASSVRPTVDPALPPLVSVRDLRISVGGVEVVRGVGFDVHDGEVFALVGESGAGKSLTARSLLGLAPPGARTAGSVRLRGTELVGARRARLAALWGRRVSLVPQDSLSALSPVHPVGDQLAAAVRSVRGVSRAAARARAAAALDRVGVPAARAGAYPHELSGGMRQRAVIAMATVNEPDLLVADEPTTALDPDRRALVLELLAEQRAATGAALVLVTHDLDAVRDHADRVLVLYAGRHVESGAVATVLERPRAPYTAGLLACLPTAPRPAAGRSRYLPTIGGAPPPPGEPATGCAFAPRCPAADAGCRARTPLPRPVDGRDVSCHRAEHLPGAPGELFAEAL